MKPLLSFIWLNVLLVLFGMSTLQTARAQEAAGEHQLSPGDSIDIRVYQETDLDAAKVLVSKEGRVSVQLVGEVDVQGMTVNQAARAIETRLKNGYLVNPKVTVNISGFKQQRFTVLGSVNKPGAYNYPSGQVITVSEAVGMAGGYKAGAKESDIKITRPGIKEPMKVNGKTQGDTQIKANDVIKVEESPF